MSTSTKQETWLTIRAAARDSGLSEWAITRLVRQGDIRTLVLPGSRPKVCLEDLNALISRSIVAPTAARY